MFGLARGILAKLWSPRATLGMPSSLPKNWKPSSGRGIGRQRNMHEANVSGCGKNLNRCLPGSAENISGRAKAVCAVKAMNLMHELRMSCSHYRLR